MIIDSHVHLYPPEVAVDPGAWAQTAGEPHWAVLSTRRRRDGRAVQTFPTGEELLRAMDAAGIDRAVLLGWYWEKPATCVWQNRFFAACVRAHPDRLSAFATIHPAAGLTETLAEVRRVAADGLIGLGELSPHSQGFAIDDPVFAAVLEYAGTAGLPINLHVTDPVGRSYPGRVETRLDDFVQLARSFPRNTFILAHWGGLLPQVMPAAAGGALPNIFYDTAASPLLYPSTIWSRADAVFGRDRVLFGSDYPLTLYPKDDRSDGLTRLVAEAKAGGASPNLLGRTAARLLHL